MKRIKTATKTKILQKIGSLLTEHEIDMATPANETIRETNTQSDTIIFCKTQINLHR
jgi:hypothetical protein